MQRALALFLLAAGLVHAGDAAPTRWALDAGWGVRLWDNSGIPEAERHYLEKSRVGGTWGLDVSAYPWKRWGFGIQHAEFSASASDSNATFADNSKGNLRDAYRIFYTAPAVCVMRSVGKNMRLAGNAGAGVFFYRNESRAGAFPGVLEGSTLGLHAAGGIDLMIAPRLALGFGIRLLYGTLEKIRYNAIETSTRPISLSRLDFGVGLRFYP